jgi:transposase InsO family protein
LALAWPTWGPQRLTVQLARQGVIIAPSTVYRTLKRLGLGTRRQRLGLLELHSAERAGLLTERTRKLREVRRKKRHVEARLPGDLVCIDCFYIGKLKGVGRVWQLTACDAASSFGAARVVALRQPTAKALERFLREVLVPLYRQAGWPLKRVLTDNGSEFKGDFAQACEQLGIRHTRTKPGHAWTNGFVERLQGTILHEHWRVEFRRRYFTRVAQLEVSLQRFLRFYNEQRPHHGYRLRGRTPSELFRGAQA